MKKFFIRLFAFLAAMTVLGVLFVIGVIGYFSMSLPQISSLADYNPPIPSKVYSKDGEVLLEIFNERRQLVNFEDVPQVIVDAFLAAEDDNFFEHDGIDYTGIFRALVANIKAGRVVQGGSTITQQVAKSLLLTRDRSIRRKIQDFLLALRIEEKFTKEEILYLYLNQVYLGGGYYGIHAAFDGYFGKSLEEATIAESAIIAGLLVAPGRYSPYRNPRAAKMRQNYVLRRMFETGKITEEEYRAAQVEQIRFQDRRPSRFKAGHFSDWIRQRLIRKLGEDELRNGGYRIYTTLNWRLQKKAEDEMMRGLKEIDKRQGYSGPLKNLGSDSEVIREWELEKRAELLRSFSSYFVLNEDLERVYEFEIDEEWLERRDEHLEKWDEVVGERRFVAGNVEGDQLLASLEGGEMYPAVVLHADNWQRLIYVSVGGAIGIIPFNHFRWARERSITNERENWSWVTRPSDIVSPGDVVLARLIRRSVSIWPHVHAPHRDQLAEMPNKDKLQKIRDARYMLMFLDQEPEVEGALLSISPQTGEIVSFVGGYDFRRSQFSRATQARRQSGSAFKPLVFAAALEEGYTPSTIVLDTPEALAGVEEGLNWKPRNYDGQFKGPITFRNALEQSRNVPTIKIAEDIGVRKIHEFVDRVGFNAKLPPDLTLSLGTFGSTLLDMVTTFGIFPNGGRLIEPKSIIRIVDRHGREVVIEEEIEEDVIVDTYADEYGEIEAKELDPFEDRNEVDLELAAQIEEIVEEEKINPFLENLTDTQVYDERLAYIMTNLLRGVVLHGTGRGASHISSFLGGKTGTTNNFVDAWFVGFSSNVVTGVWTGFDDNRPVGWAETGARSALPIWSAYMSEALRVFGENDFRIPPGIINVMVDKETGEPARRGSQSSFMEAFVEGTEPGARPRERQDPSTIDFDADLFEEDEYFINQ